MAGGLAFHGNHAPASCVTDISRVFQNLAVLSSPWLATVCFLAGLVAATVAVYVLVRADTFAHSDGKIRAVSSEVEP